MSMRPQGQGQNNQYLMSCPKKKCKTQISRGSHELMETFSDSFQDLYWKYPFQFLWLRWECASECDILDFFRRKGESRQLSNQCSSSSIYSDMYMLYAGKVTSHKWSSISIYTRTFPALLSASLRCEIAEIAVWRSNWGYQSASLRS